MTIEPGEKPENTGEPIAGIGDNGIAARAVRGTAYRLSSSLFTWVLGAARLLLLMRLLDADAFGVVAQAMLFLNLMLMVSSFGLDAAYIQAEKGDRKHLSTYFTLRISMLVGGLGLLALAAPILGQWYKHMPLLRIVLLVFVAVEPLGGLNEIQATVLRRRLEFRRLAMANVAGSLAATLLAAATALSGWGVYSLVMERLGGSLGRMLVLWTAQSRWIPRFGWDSGVARRFLRFGLTFWTGKNLAFVVDRFDDFWVGRVLGQTALGLYSRSFLLASYPRRLVADPILSVFFPTYSHLQKDRLRLSRAFFRATSFMVRLSGWISLMLLVAAPELIRLGPGAQWLPMLRTFQLMVIYVALSPLNMGVNNILIATGHPHIVVRMRLIQAFVFVGAVIGLVTYQGDIEGVALAVDIAALAGTFLLFRQVRRIVDFSSRALWRWPVISALITGAVTVGLDRWWAAWPLWISLLGKLSVISLVYFALLWLTERDQLETGWRMIRGIMLPGIHGFFNRSSR